jgi:hypothetical protein
MQVRYAMSTVRKRRLEMREDEAFEPGELNIAELATIAYSSEDPDHPVERLLRLRTGPGQLGWVAAQADTTEQLVLEFDRPQRIGRLVYEVLETERERTQEVHLEASIDAGQTYRRVLVQEYTFSPEGATFQHEDLRLDLDDLTHLRLTIVPNKRGSGVATLSRLRVFA